MDDSKKYDLIFKILGWGFVFAFIFPGIVLLLHSGHVFGLALICVALPVTDTTWRVVEKITNRQLSSNTRVIFTISSFLMVLLTGVHYSQLEIVQVAKNAQVVADQAATEQAQDNQEQIVEQPTVEPSALPSPSPSPSPTINVEESIENTPAQPAITEQVNLQDQIINFEELGTNRKSEGEIWSNIAVSFEATDEELIKLARKLHEDSPNQKFRIFGSNNAAMVSKYKAWDEHYPDEENYPYPEEWANKYYLGIINRMPSSEKSILEWQLVMNKSGKSYSL